MPARRSDDDDLGRLRAALAVMAPRASSTESMVRLLRVAESQAAFNNGMLRHAARQMSGEIRHGAPAIDDTDALELIERGLSPIQVARRVVRLEGGGNAHTVAQRLRAKLRQRK